MGCCRYEMKELLKLIAPRMRELGFKGTGQNFRRSEGDLLSIVNFQSSRTGDVFFVNLGAQPAFVPATGFSELKSLKEYECMLRCRVGTEWSWGMSELELDAMVTEIAKRSSEFFGQALTLRQALTQADVPELIRNFSSGTTQARAALHLARGAHNLGLHEKAMELANHGLAIAEDRAEFLIADLRTVLAECATATSQPKAR